MTMFEKRSTGTTHNDHDSHRDHDNCPGWDSHQQQAGLTAAEEVMSRWTGAFYDYAEQILKAQRQFAHRLLGAGAPMRDIAQDVMSSDANERRSGNQMETRSDQHYERFNDDTAKFSKRVDSDISGDSTSDTSKTGRANTHTDEPAKTPGRGAASAAPRLS
jgi:hypothetical protein